MSFANYPLFTETRRAHVSLVVVFLLVHTAGSVFINQYFFAQPILGHIHRITYGLVEPTLLAGVIMLLVPIGLVLFLVGRLRPRDVGLQARHILPAVLTTVQIWLAAQVLLLVVRAVQGEPIALHASWAEPGYVVGGFVAQAFGNALSEEVAFRGFLFVQVFLLLQARKPGQAGTNLILAMVLSQAAFALLHIPNRIMKGLDAGAMVTDQIRLLVGGLFFVLIYLRTRNLFVAVGLHALGNAPVPLLQADGTEVAAVLLVLTILLLIFWRRPQAEMPPEPSVEPI